HRAHSGRAGRARSRAVLRHAAGVAGPNHIRARAVAGAGELNKRRTRMKDNADMPATGVALSETLADYAAGFDGARIPTEVRERARLLMLDSIGIALASHGYDFSRRALAAVSELDGGGDSVVIGTRLRLDSRNAALANGVLVHGLDYDDTHARGVIHATASV